MPKQKRKYTKKVKVEEKPLVTITFQHGDEVLMTSGNTILEALSSLPLPKKIVGKSWLSVVSGTKKVKRMYMPVEAKRLFYPLAQTITAKKLNLLLR